MKAKEASLFQELNCVDLSQLFISHFFIQQMFPKIFCEIVLWKNDCFHMFLEKKKSRGSLHNNIAVNTCSFCGQKCRKDIPFLYTVVNKCYQSYCVKNYYVFRMLLVKKRSRGSPFFFKFSYLEKKSLRRPFSFYRRKSFIPLRRLPLGPPPHRLPRIRVAGIDRGIC